MPLDGQTTTVLIIVASAVVYLARTVWQRLVRRRALPCGGCGRCPAGVGDREPQVVDIEKRSPGAAKTERGATSG